MKKIKMIYGWILISVLLQVAVLSYINFVYLPGRGAVKATTYESEGAAVKSRGYRLPGDATDVVVSFDGLYTAYRQGDKLTIADLDRKKTIKSLDAGEGAFSFYKWIPDREMLIYSTKEPEGKTGQVLISTYDIGADLERSYPVIKGLAEGSEVSDIVQSPLTNVVYTKINTTKTKAKIYKFDIMDNLKYIMGTNRSTKLFELLYSDTLVYQVPEAKIQIRSGRNGKISRLPVKEADELLSVDDNDVIYTAATDKEGSLTTIFSGKAEQSAEQWQTVTLEHPLKQENLYVTDSGALYYADAENKQIQALEGTGATVYQGDLLTVLDDYVVSIDNGKLVLKILKKE